jgi:hypothetical protein
MITCNLQGGLGNQLFQIYTTIAHADRINSRFFFFNITELKSSVTNRYTYWNTFLSRLQIFLIDHALINQNNISIIKEKGFTYNALPNLSIKEMRSKKIRMLSGYFQSYKYFDEYYHTINRMLRIDDYKVRVTNKYLKLVNEDTPISMHFRRGDYKNLSNFYVLLNTNYYKAGLRHVLDINADKTDKLSKVLYFCEDHDVEDVDNMIQNIKSEFPTILFERADPLLEDWEQLILMSLCRHNIIANSTFSWWGAYLNTSREKTVICPSDWFGPTLQQTHDLKDLYLTDWIKI